METAAAVRQVFQQHDALFAYEYLTPEQVAFDGIVQRLHLELPAFRMMPSSERLQTEEVKAARAVLVGTWQLGMLTVEAMCPIHEVPGELHTAAEVLAGTTPAHRSAPLLGVPPTRRGILGFGPKQIDTGDLAAVVTENHIRYDQLWMQQPGHARQPYVRPEKVKTYSYNGYERFRQDAENGAHPFNAEFAQKITKRLWNHNMRAREQYHEGLMRAYALLDDAPPPMPLRV